jgi:hypothetical protein
VSQIWIIGSGRFGRLALQRLTSARGSRAFTLVDPDPAQLRSAEGPAAETVVSDGVAFLVERLERTGGPDWIIPAVPVHLAAEWCLSRLGPERVRRIDLPPGIESRLAHPMTGPSGDIYVSHADFICPDDCPEPAGHCTVTQQPRKPNMFDQLADISVPGGRSLVLRSHQLGPGVGGYRPEALLHLLDQLGSVNGPVLVSTACRCHGVVTPMTVLDRPTLPHS